MARPPHRSAAPLGVCSISVKLNRLSYEYAPTSTRKTSSATVNACSMKEATGLIIGLQEQRKEDLSSNMVLPNMRNGISAKTTRNRRATSAVQVSLWDFNSVHRCAVLAAEARAGQYKHANIELAAAHLHGMLEELMAMQHREAKGHGHVSPH